MIGTELKYAFRSIRRQRFATVLILTMLTLGMAANIVVFSVVNELFLKPFPFPEPDRLVYINEKAPQWNLERTGVNYQDFDQWRKAALVFEGMGVVDDVLLNLSDEQGAERVEAARITYDYMTVLGVTPLRGRLFTADEDKPNAPFVALISESMWRDRFANDEAVLAKTLKLNGRVFQIVGVLPRRAEFPQRARIWIPMQGDPTQNQGYSYDTVARLKPGVAVEAAEQDLLRAHQPIFDARDKERVVSPFAMPLRDNLVRDFRSIARALFAAVALLLVVACANVAAVMLARAIARRREMGIRLAVGANRWRLLRQLFVENVLLAIAGGVLGAVLGRWALTVLVAAAGDGLPSWASFGLDGRVIGFAVLITLATAVLFGWAPAFHAVRGDLRTAMTDSSAASTAPPSGRRTLTWLVAAEFALAAVLLVGGGLLFRAFGQVRNVDPGFRADHVLTFQVSLPGLTYSDGPKRLAFWDRLLERIRASAGVEAAGVISCPPLGCHWGNFYKIEGRPPLKPGETNPVVLSRVASSGYFEAMGIRLKAGRFFEPRDGQPDTPQAVIVNDMFAKTFWPGETNVVGKHVAFNGDKEPWMTVVGVTADIKHYGLERPMRPGLYFPAPQQAQRTSGMTVAIRTTGDPEAFAATARALVREMDPTLPLFRMQSMEQALAESMRGRAGYSWMLAVFAGLALLLALGGTYGVTSYLVTQRHREIGIRMAIGARAADIVREILRGSLTWVSVGVVVGLLGAILLAGFLGDLLFGVSPRDPIVLVSAAVALAVAALVANWLPARRAARTSPMASLRI
jgi:putative ABC transport system permease protein